MIAPGITETEWNLKRENLQLRIQLAVAQSQLLQAAHDKALAEYQAMGEKWEPDETGAGALKNPAAP